MKPFSITAPEEIAKDYGGDKRKIQQAAARGLIDPTSAVLAGMFIDRIRGAAAKEQAAQPSVAEQVMNPMPQPQMPSAGLAASPQAAQMQQPAAPRMGQPAMGRMPQPAPARMPPAQQPPMQQPMGMAMGGGLDSIDYVEGSYAPGGIVSFSTAGGVSADSPIGAYASQINALTQLLNDPTLPQRDREKAELKLNEVSMKAKLEQQTLATQDLMRRESDSVLPGVDPDVAGLVGVSAPEQGAIVGGTDYPTVPTAPGQLNFELPGPIGSPTETNAYTSGSGLANTQVAKDFGVDAVPLTEQQQAMQDDIMRAAERRSNAPLIPAFLTDAYDAAVKNFGGRNVVGTDAYLRTQGTADMNALDRIAAEKDSERGGLIGLIDQGVRSVVDAGESFADAGGRDAVQSVSNTIRNLISGQPEPDAYTGATMPAPEPDTVEDQTAQTQQQTTTPEPETETQQTTLADQVEEVNKATEDLKPNTVEKDDPNAAKTALDAANAEADAMTEAAQDTASDDFQKQIEDLMQPAEKGEFRKEMEALVKDRGARLKSAKKEAFSMALLQAGLGMLGQGGGQTALQALGKAALPATKQYASAVKDAKKEDRELLQLGLSLEQMDAKEAAATKRAIAQLYGKRSAAMLQSATSMANNVRTTAASEYGADVRREVGLAQAAAQQAAADQTGALRQQISRSDNLRMERAELNDLVDKQAEALQADPTYSMAKMLEQAAYARLAKDPQNETLRAEYMLARNEAQKAQDAFMSSSPYAKLIQEQRGVVQSLGTGAVDFSSLNP